MTRRAGLMAVAFFAMYSALADTATWMSDVLSGSWTNAANWTGGILPSETTSASIERSGADYTVTIDSDSTILATNVVVGNANGTTTLYVDSPISFFPRKMSAGDHRAFQQNAGTRTVVRSSGKMEMDGAGTGYLLGTCGYMKISKSELVVDGGEINFVGDGKFAMEGAASAPATLVVTNGGIVTYRLDVTGDKSFTMDANSRLVVHDSKFIISDPRNMYHAAPFQLLGGNIRISGTGMLCSTNMTTSAIAPLALNSGSVTFCDDAKLVAGGGQAVVFQPRNDTDLLSVSFTGCSTFGTSEKVYVGDSHGRTVFDWNSSASLARVSTDPSIVRNLFVGYNRGVGEMNIRNGCLSLGGYGIYVGSAMKTGDDYRRWGGAKLDDPAQFCPTGILRMVGGVLVSMGVGARSDSWNAKRLVGLMIGDGSRNFDEYSGRPCYGRFELSGGSVTNTDGNFVVGYGHAVGRVVQTGGDFFKGDPSTTWSASHSVVIGLAGGDGAYVISNGTFTANTRIFVGGASFDDLDTGISFANTGFPVAPRDSKGVLTLACHDKTKPIKFKVNATNAGNIKSIKGVWVGRDGDGTVELIGSGATLDVQYTGLTLTNGFTVAHGETDTEGELLTHGQATLRFVFDEDGAGLVDSRYATVNIAPNAKLEVDMSAYTNSPRTVTLIKRKDSTGGFFAPENILLRNCILIQDSTEIKARYRRDGFMILVK